MKKSRIIITLFFLGLMPFFLIGAFSFYTYNRLSDQRETANLMANVSPQTTSSPTPKAPIIMSQKIEEGLALLKKAPPLEYENKIIINKSGKKIQTADLLRKQITLAVLDIDSGLIIEKRVWVYEDDIRNFSTTGSMSFEPAEGSEPLIITAKRWNSFNTYYEVTGRPDLVIIANKYLLESSLLGTLPERSVKKYTEIFYVPFSPALATRDLIKAGKEYINLRVSEAFTALEQKKVMSVVIKNKLITEDIPKEFIKSIILIEHIDPDLFDVSVDGGKELSERVLTIIGANKANAYRYTGSPAGANGLAQFIKPTYQNITDSFPDAKLIKDYNQGMADHVNAIQAMALFFDYYGKDIEDKIIRPDVFKQLGLTDEMLAAAYNGGPAKVSSSINKYGLTWLSAQINLLEKDRIFRDETLNYLKKLNSIKEMDIFN